MTLTKIRQRVTWKVIIDKTEYTFWTELNIPFILMSINHPIFLSFYDPPVGHTLLHWNQSKKSVTHVLWPTGGSLRAWGPKGLPMRRDPPVGHTLKLRYSETTGWDKNSGLDPTTISLSKLKIWIFLGRRTHGPAGSMTHRWATAVNVLTGRWAMHRRWLDSMSLVIILMQIYVK